MLMRIFFLIMCGVVGRDFYHYSVDHSYAWIQYKYFIAFGVFMFAMTTLTLDRKFKF